jgi:hypothetical protein
MSSVGPRLIVILVVGLIARLCRSVENRSKYGMGGNSRHRQPDALFNAQVSVNGAFSFSDRTAT